MKNAKPRISIVVPIYKVEEYLDKCIKSLINQTYKEIEIILVDDGSPDRCPKMCDEYAEEDDRIKVIHKVNGGLSDARNYGLKESTGEYVLFVDSDDYIELDTCEKFLYIIKSNKPDIIVGNAYRINNNKSYLMKHSMDTNGKMIRGTEYLKEELKSSSMYMAAWLNLYNREFLVKNNLQFSVGLLHEDEEFTPRAFLKASNVIGTDIFFYNYLIREGSITTAKNKLKNAEHMMKICNDLESVYGTIPDLELKKLLNNNLVDKFLNTFQVAELYDKKKSNLIDKSFLIGKSCTTRNKMRVALFIINKKLYFYVNKISKKLKS